MEKDRKQLIPVKRENNGLIAGLMLRQPSISNTYNPAITITDSVCAVAGSHTEVSRRVHQYSQSRSKAYSSARPVSWETYPRGIMLIYGSELNEKIETTPASTEADQFVYWHTFPIVTMSVGAVVAIGDISKEDYFDRMKNLDYASEVFNRLSLLDKARQEDEDRFEQLTLDIDAATYSAAIEVQFEQLLEKSALNEKFINNQVPLPNVASKEKAKEFMYLIINKIKVLPIRVSPSIEEGIMFTYWNSLSGKTLKIETYNNGENPAGIVNKDKEILLTRDIDSEQDLEQLLACYNWKE